MSWLPLLAYRSWRTRLDSNLLYSISRENTWQRREIASCPHQHEVPNLDCECGIYSTSSVRSAEHYRETFAPWDLSRGYILLSMFLGCLFFTIPSLALINHFPAVLASYLVLFLTVFVGPAAGLYAALLYFPRRSNGILGIVGLRGKVLIYGHVMRSSQAELICLIRPFSLPRTKAVLIAQEYNVPLFEFWQGKKAWAYALEHGNPRESYLI